jgi:hypothetical protein
LPELPEEVEVGQVDLAVLGLQVAREPELPPPSREYWCRPLEVRYRSRRGDVLVFQPYACYSEDPRLLGGELALLYVYAKPALAAAESGPASLEELELPYYDLVLAMFDDPIRALLRDKQSTPIPAFFAPATGGFVAVAVLKGNMYRLGSRTVANILRDIKHVLNIATPGVDRERSESREVGVLGGKTVEELTQEVGRILGEEERAGRALVVEVGAG